MLGYFSLKQNLIGFWLIFAVAVFTNHDAQAYAYVTDELAQSDNKQEQTDKDKVSYGHLLMDYFFAAARTGNVEVLNQFIDSGFPVDQRNSQSYTALMVAAYHGQLQATKILLQHGANACLQDKRGNIAIMGALIKAEFAIVKQLYQQECSAKLTNKSGMTLEEFARYWGQEDKLKSAREETKQQTPP
ncbi:ankyrin repeat domain-containing protein [Shewanella pneumatophori]|uniref:Protein fem-1 homolog B n=1 Tax=Shewanella pneumatophori TaxID=314092 RepID=A0A9X1ZDZ2_9GAMM|nr:ankyrin repeat domain-containing protein [Shewanella pneumatophori]MCL1140519.1 ankyrin repeat domain-containing protein [Shewanella pneumatophori]